MSSVAWPYPTLFAHRGGGVLAPENTLAGMAKALEKGFQAVEFDVKLSQDGVCILMHDDTLERTSNGRGAVAGQSYAQLAALDVGSWLAPQFAGEAIPTFEAVAAYCRQHGLQANVEIKPCPGREVETGERVAREALRLWQGAAVPPLLSSFSYEALQAARAVAPQLPIGWLVEDWPDNWLGGLAALGAASLNTDEALLSPARVREVHDAGYRLLAYTVNHAERARELLAWGVDGLFTDALATLPAAVAQSCVG